MRAHELSTAALSGNAYLLKGDDAYWLRQAKRFFVAKVPEEEREFNLRVLNSANFDAIVDAVETMSMFPSDPVVIVEEGAYKEAAADKARLAELVANLQSAILVFVNTALSPAIKSKLTVIDCKKSDVFEARKRIPEMTRAISAAAVDRLIEYTGRDMAAIETECRKLEAYVGSRKIEVEDVELLVANSVENELYEFSGALAAKNKKQAMTILDRFRRKGVASSYLLATLIGQYRRMLYAAISPLSPKELAAHLGVKEFAVKKAGETASRYSKSGLKNILFLLTEAELKFKSGEMSEDTAFRTAVARLLDSEAI